MNCTEAQNLLHAYADGELDVVRTLEVEQHLRECSACAQVYSNQQVLSKAIRTGSLYFQSPPQLRKRIQSSVRQASKPQPTVMRGVTWRWLAVAAALLFVVLGAWSLLNLQSAPSQSNILTQEVLSSHLRSLQANHLVDVPSSDQHTVKPWFNGKLDFSPTVVDLTSQGYPLLGGRLDYLADQPVAAIVYRRREHIINLFIWPSTQDSGRASTTVTRQGYHLIHWTSSGMTYWAVSDVTIEDLQQFVHLIQNQT